MNRPVAISTPSALPILVIVSGLPATGKTTLAAQLRDELGWPLFAKDAFKELLYDALDRGREPFDRDDSAALGKESIAILFAVARELLETGASCIIEANFLPWFAAADLEPLLAIADGRQVHCTIPDDQVVQRYRDRARSGKRHPVHVDQAAIDELAERIAQGGGNPLPIVTPLLEVDATDGFTPGLREIVAFCRGQSRSP